MDCSHKNIKYFKDSKCVVCWDCGNHFYRYNPRVSKDTIKKIFNMREKGFTFSEIGKEIGVSRQRVWQIFKNK